ncbi:anaerobic glycerol-3-phosphate dehydrogenase subunit GlpA [Trueperella bialowiezensis]|uniref:Anaerobic glycerol-3-phosphate dehydrogenase subunit A n=1 Tax=Trueperella bialowiezensis TaxID=312285 RepID=A0A3S4UZL4_9ACTO|nr:anaerobic glycerol-3-phosphate dehydrogenase subunit GlpA [Trueperella bialowiezensis]VEI13673.1 Anaerobic glycerol-3-phosphate dehydrogenase subunit A [Trueperella bialowiezensis]
MNTVNTDVVVIGGGATGAGALRDLAMRGFKTVLVERADLAQGTSGRFHGLLHSGGRYVISDPHSATECAEENAILRRIHADSVEETGGLFVVGPNDDPEYSTRFLAAAQETRVPAHELTIKEALTLEPRLNPGIQRAFHVEDGSVDGWAMVWGCVESAREYGGQVLTYHRVTKIHSENGNVSQVVCTNEKTGEVVKINCRAVINAGGPWAGQIAQMAGAHGVDVVPGRGIMIAMNHRLVNMVVNRCIHPADGDIIVPAHTVSIIGTTDQRADDPDFLEIKSSEVQQMLDSGEDLIPGFRKARAVHAWAGARPLVKDSRVDESDTRHMSRGMSIIDHSTRDGISGFFTIAGGKLTTYRLMAKNIVDVLLTQMGEFVECTTADEPVPPRAPRTHKITDRLKEAEEHRHDDPILCECELLRRSVFEQQLEAQPEANLDDLRRRTRLGMGPCQGTFCGMRTAGVMHEKKAATITDPQANADRTSAMLRLFVKNRFSGLESLMYGEQLREAALNKWILAGNLDIDHLPAPGKDAVVATGDLELLHGRPVKAKEA